MTTPNDKDLADIARFVRGLDQRLGKIEQHLGLEPDALEPTATVHELEQSPPAATEPAHPQEDTKPADGPLSSAATSVPTVLPSHPEEVKPEAPIVKQEEVAPQAVPPALPTPQPQATEVPQPQVAEAPQREVKAATKKGGNFEVQFGSVWLFRAGALLFIIGAASWLVKSYQDFGPMFKICSGLITSLLLIGGGEFFSIKKPSMRWYGLGLTGAGYALGYFTLYAMYHIASVKLIDDPVLDLTLLLGLAGCCIAHSIVRKTENVALFGTVLALVTFSLSTLSFYSATASTILVVALGAVVVLMGWYRLFLLGAVGTFGTYLFFTAPQLQGIGPDTIYGALLPAAFLGAYWLVNNVVALCLPPADTQEKRLSVLGVLAVSAAGFVVPTFFQAGVLLPEWRFSFLLGTAAVYAVFAVIARVTKRPGVENFHVLVALQLATVAVPLKLDAEATSIFWLSEVAFLVVAGLQLRVLAFRWFAGALAAVTLTHLFAIDLMPIDIHQISLFGHQIDWRWMIGYGAVASYAVAAFAYRSPRYLAAQSPQESVSAYAAYFVCAAAVALAVPALMASPETAAVMVAVQGTALAALGLFTRDKMKLASSAGGIYLLLALAQVFMTPESMNLYSIIAIVGLTYLVSFAHRYCARTEQADSARYGHLAYLIGALGVTLYVTAVRMGLSDPRTMLVLGGEALAVVAGGFALKDSGIRRVGTFAFGAAIFTANFSIGHWTWETIVPLAAIFYGMHVLYSMQRPADTFVGKSLLDQPFYLSLDAEHAKISQLHFIVGSGLLATAFAVIGPFQWLALSLAAQFGLTVALGMALRKGFYHNVGAIGLAVTAFVAGTSIPTSTWGSVLPVVAVFYSLYIAHQRLYPGLPPVSIEELSKMTEKELFKLGSASVRTAYGIVGALLLVAATQKLMNPSILSLGWAVEALAFVALGFAVRDKIQRWIGLAVCGVITLKMLLVDYSGAQTTDRILSFIFAGIILVVVSIAYGWLSKKLDATPSAPVDAPEADEKTDAE